MEVTKHAKKRMKTRLGVSKKISDKIAIEAYENGIKHKDTKGKLNKYITYLFFKNKEANNCRIYKEKVFIFADNRLVTVFDLPLQYKKYLLKINNKGV